MEAHPILVELFVLFAAAKLFGEVFGHFGQPEVVGELLAGVLVGPHVLGLVRGGEGEILQLVGELGVILLLFTVGLETSVQELRRVGRAALLVGILGVVFPFALGVALMLGLDHNTEEALFVAAAMVATSVGITARVLRDLRAVRTVAARVVLAAAVVDDILAIMVLAVVAGLAEGDLSTTELGLTFGLVAAFLVVAVLAGPRLVRSLSRMGHLPFVPNSPFIIAMLLTLGLAALSETIGLAAIIGAFLAGLIFDYSREEVASQVQPVYDLFVPLFFAITGSILDPGVFAEGSILGLAAVVTVIAIVTKVAGGWLGAAHLGRRTALTIGVGMVPRGEVGLIVASLGLGLGVISSDIFGVVVAMTVVTTLATPPVLGPLVRRHLRELRDEEARRRDED